MAARLVKEIIAFCRTESPIIFVDHSPTRLSFVCHSLGGLIVRKALEDPEMAPLLPKLHMFLSMACPHLGTLFYPFLLSPTLFDSLISSSVFSYALQHILTIALVYQLSLSTIYQHTHCQLTYLYQCILFSYYLIIFILYHHRHDLCRLSTGCNRYVGNVAIERYTQPERTRIERLRHHGFHGLNFCLLPSPIIRVVGLSSLGKWRFESFSKSHFGVVSL